MIEVVRRVWTDLIVRRLATRCRVETFEYEISELILHEANVHVLQNARGFSFDDTNVVYTP